MNPTPEHCRAWWESVQDSIQAIIRDSEHYLPPPDDETVLDNQTVQDILNSLFVARAYADTVVGAYARDARHNPRPSPKARRSSREVTPV